VTSEGYDNLILARQKALKYEDTGLHCALLVIFTDAAAKWKHEFDHGVEKLLDWWFDTYMRVATGNTRHKFEWSVAKDCDAQHEPIINLARAYLDDDVE
jgi:hypothetical protein